MQKSSTLKAASSEEPSAKVNSRKRKRPQRFIADEEGRSDGDSGDASPVSDYTNGAYNKGQQRSRSMSPSAIATSAATNGNVAASGDECDERVLPEEAKRATDQQDFARIVKPWLAKTVAGLEGRQLDDAVSERWAQVVAQRLSVSTSASTRPSRASRDKAIRDMAMSVEFDKAASRKRFYDDVDYSAPERKKRPKPKAVADLRSRERSRSKAKASESEVSVGSDSEYEMEITGGSPAQKPKSKKGGKQKKVTLNVESSRDGTDQSGSSEAEVTEDDYDEFCKVCREGGDLLCCDNCPCTFHMTCLNPPLQSVPEETWVCPRCLAEPLKSKVGRVLSWRWRDPPLLPLTEEEVAAGLEPHIAPGAKRVREFLVKYRDLSFWDAEFVTELQFEVHEVHLHRSVMQKFKREGIWSEPPGPADPDNVVKGDTLEADLLNAGIAEDFLVPQRIVMHRDGEEGGRNYFVKWRELTYENCTWESLDVHSDMPRHLEKYNNLRSTSDPRLKKKKKKEKLLPRQKSVKICSSKYEKQPDFLTGTLHPYQLEGLNWLRFSWAQDTNTILADEMGLGKTIQTIAFLSSLVKEGHCSGPFLVSAPLSTLINWEREFEFWAPDLYAVTYCGPQDARKVLRDTEFSFEEDAIKPSAKLFKIKSGASLKFHVLLTSFEMVTHDKTLLQSIDWEVLVIDEAHRLKNNKSLYFRIMSTYSIKYTLLLTGTPLQNTLEELFHLLNFLAPKQFCDMTNFLTEFEDISKENQVIKLHDLLGPHLLRRLKADVLKTMPTKTELLVRVDLAPMQKSVYRSILTRNFDALNSRKSAGGSGGSVTLLNVMMDLKKCCNHPYLFPAPAEEAARNMNGNYEGRALVEACGKFSLLEKMLTRLKKNGHRVLIFSQMTRVLDLLEDFLEYKEYSYERIDGGVSGSTRQLAIDRFNAPGSSGFVFLLSTRAGGLGINLATADTVIIYDSDWNPHNDIQALSRAHRIGQQKTVMIYRFVTRSSVEERVAEVAKRKMMLTHMVVRPGLGGESQAQFTKKEMDDILRFGTQQLFEDENENDGGKDGDGEGAKDGGRIVYDDEMLDKLLDRTQQSNVTEMKDGLNEYFSAFKVASFSLKESEPPEPEVEVVKQDDDTQIDANYWEHLLRGHVDRMVQEEQLHMGKGKRQRKAVNYMDSGYQDTAYEKAKHDDPDASFSNEESSVDEDDESLPEKSTAGSRKRVRKPIRSEEAAPPPPLMAYVDKQLQVLGFTFRQRKSFHTSVMRFGLPHTMDFGWLPFTIKKRKPEAHIRMYMNMYMRHLCEPANKDQHFADGVPKDSVNPDVVLNRIGIMKLIRQKVLSYKSTNGPTSRVDSAPAAGASTPGTSLPATATSSSASSSDASSAAVAVATAADRTASTDSSTAAVTTTGVNGDSGHTGGAAAQKEPQKFMFNIADGGFTELHARWAKERRGPGAALSVAALMVDETDGLVEQRWGRRHDYWVLYGIVEHGYARWPDLLIDPNLVIIGEALHGVVYENKIRYLSRRLKLLEQALLIEEQLKKAHSQTLIQDPKSSVMTLNQKFAELEALMESNQYLVQPALVKNKSANRVLINALARMDELLADLRTEVGRLPNLLAGLPSISQRLGLSQEAIIRQALDLRGAVSAPVGVLGQPPELVPAGSSAGVGAGVGAAGGVAPVAPMMHLLAAGHRPSTTSPGPVPIAPASRSNAPIASASPAMKWPGPVAATATATATAAAATPLAAPPAATQSVHMPTLAVASQPPRQHTQASSTAAAAAAASLPPTAPLALAAVTAGVTTAAGVTTTAGATSTAAGATVSSFRPPAVPASLSEAGQHTSGGGSPPANAGQQQQQQQRHTTTATPAKVIVIED